MVEAAHELAHAGLLQLTTATESQDEISNVCSEFELYWQFDRDVFGYDTDTDVAVIAGLISEQGSTRLSRAKKSPYKQRSILGSIWLGGRPPISSTIKYCTNSRSQ